eukprot:3247837-Rhodomonas_salina.2
MQTETQDEGQKGPAEVSQINSTIFVKGLAAESSKEEVTDAFAKFGSVKGVRCRTSRGFGFVEFEKREGMLAAVQASTVQIGGSEISIEECNTVRQKKKKKKKKGNAKEPGDEGAQEQGDDKGGRDKSTQKKKGEDGEGEKKKKKRKNTKPRGPSQKADIVPTGNVRDDAVARALAEKKMRPDSTRCDQASQLPSKTRPRRCASRRLKTWRTAPRGRTSPSTATLPSISTRSQPAALFFAMILGSDAAS